MWFNHETWWKIVKDCDLTIKNENWTEWDEDASHHMSPQMQPNQMIFVDSPPFPTFGSNASLSCSMTGNLDPPFEKLQECISTFWQVARARQTFSQASMGIQIRFAEYLAAQAIPAVGRLRSSGIRAGHGTGFNVLVPLHRSTSPFRTGMLISNGRDASWRPSPRVWQPMGCVCRRHCHMQ